MDLIAGILVFAPLAGAWASWKLWRWYKFYGTRFLWGLFVASVAADLAALPVAFLAGRRLALGPDAPRLVGASELVGLALLVFEGVFVYLVLRWKDLDAGLEAGPDEVVDGETRNQREDRQFGEERRSLEAEHLITDANEENT